MEKKIEVNYEELEKAIAVVEDFLFMSELSNENPEELKLLKLLQARSSNNRFEYDLAEMICGEDDYSFPYRSSYYLTQFFNNLGFNFQHDGTTRRFWVENVLKQLNIKDIALIIRKGLFNKRDFRIYAKKENLKFEDLYKSAIQEFKNFIDDSINDNKELDLSFLLNLNVNTELLFNEKLTTKDEILNNLIQESKNRFLNPNDKQIALEKIWDAFERIKTYYDDDKKKSLGILYEKVAEEITRDNLDKEFINLTQIGNTYRIRHHEKGKKEISNPNLLNYLYFRVLSLIDFCIKTINDYGG